MHMVNGVIFSVQDFGINKTLSDRLEGMSAELLTPAPSTPKVSQGFTLGGVPLFGNSQVAEETSFYVCSFFVVIIKSCL